MTSIETTIIKFYCPIEIGSQLIGTIRTFIAQWWGEAAEIGMDILDKWPPVSLVIPVTYNGPSA